MTDRTPPAGWYPDETGRKRWWDGNIWTDRYEDQPAAATSAKQIQAPSARRAWLVPSIVGMAALLLGLGIGYGAGASEEPNGTSASKSVSDDVDEDEPVAVEEPDEPTFVPGVKDFSIKLSVKDRECFGSAGCNVTYRVEPSYEGLESPTGTWEITYEVRGIEDGPQVQTFTLEEDSFSFEPEVLAQTKNAGSKAKAVITNVVEGY